MSCCQTCTCKHPQAEHQRLATLAKAVADPIRVEILASLDCCKAEVCQCDFNFGIGQPTLSHHLKILKEAGLITTTRDGRFTQYHLSEKGAEIRTWLFSN